MNKNDKRLVLCPGDIFLNSEQTLPTITWGNRSLFKLTIGILLYYRAVYGHDTRQDVLLTIQLYSPSVVSQK